MDDGEKQSLERIRTLVEASEEVRFHSQDRGELYKWVNWTSRQQDYGRLKRSGKGLVRRYIAKLTGLSRAQTARLIRCHQGGSQVKPRAYQRHRLRNVPPPSRGLSTYPAQAGSDRRTAQTRSARTSWISARGYGTSRGFGWSQRSGSHQRGG